MFLDAVGFKELYLFLLLDLLISDDLLPCLIELVIIKYTCLTHILLEDLYDLSPMLQIHLHQYHDRTV